jgi:hypothetical protein
MQRNADIARRTAGLKPLVARSAATLRRIYGLKAMLVSSNVLGVVVKSDTLASRLVRQV